MSKGGGSERRPVPTTNDLGGVELHGWRTTPVYAVAALALTAGFGQFGLAGALGRVADQFGLIHHGPTLADQAGISASALGVGLALARLASLFGLPLASLADRIGRRPVILCAAATGLALTVVSALSPSYWWFVAIFALGRPSLSAVSSLSVVVASESTTSASRASAVSLVAGSYATGAGLIASLNALFGKALGFRGLFSLCLIPLLAIPVLQRWVKEPDRFKETKRSRATPPLLGTIPPRYRKLVAITATLTFGVSVITGPANSYIFLYAENVHHLSGIDVTSMVIAAGVFGLGGLLLGRWLSDHIGRRPVTGIAIVSLAAAGILTYSGTTQLLLVGYLFGVTAGGLFTPAAGALVNELLPTEVRASAAGYQIASGVLGATLGLVAFGLILQHLNSFALASTITFGPTLLTAALLLRLPETLGKEPESMWGESESL